MTSRFTRAGWSLVPFRDWSISRKIEAVIVAASVVVVLGTGSFFLVFETRKAKDFFRTRITVLTDMLAANSTGPMAFRDQEACAKLLASALSDPTVMQALACLEDGTVLASVGRGPIPIATHRLPGQDESWEEAGLLHVRRGVRLDQTPLGCVVVRSHFMEHRAHLAHYGLVVLVVMLVALLAAFLIARRLRGVVAGSLLRLAGTACRVRDTGDLSLRATSEGRDEVGELVNSFNGMLEQNQQAMEALRQSEAKFRSVFQSTSAGILLFDTLGECLDCNQTAAMLFRLQGDAAATRRHMVDANPELRTEIMALVSGSAPEHAEMLLTAGDGSTFWANVSLAPLAGPQGPPLAVTCVIVDITERRQLEADLLAAQTQEQRRMAQDIHDSLGQVLAAMVLRAKLLVKRAGPVTGGLAGDLQAMAELSAKAVQQARALAHGMNPVDVTEEGLPDALRKLADMTSQSFDVSCSYTGPDRLHLAGVETGTHLYRIAQEAARNAISHGRARHVGLYAESADGHITLRIIDNGNGFDPAHAQAHGMGLRTMQYRTRLMNGAFMIARNPDRGMTVSVTIPAG